jgi:hypothetical protein
MCHPIITASSSSLPHEFCTVLNQFYVECLCILILFNFDAWDKVLIVFILCFEFLGLKL